MSSTEMMESRAIDSFFSRIVGMIPQSLYRHTLSEDQNAVDTEEGNSKYFKHRKLPLTANERKQNSKKNMLEKYSVEMDEDGNNGNNDEEGEEEDQVEEGDEQATENKSSSNEGMDGLRERLQVRRGRCCLALSAASLRELLSLLRCTSLSAAQLSALRLLQRCLTSRAGQPSALRLHQRCLTSRAGQPSALRLHQCCLTSRAGQP
jgi:hypothetical protein